MNALWRRAVEVLALCGVALDLAAAPSPRFTHFSAEQGLSQSTVQAILQDHVGFLWFATEEGLNRYDGYSFVVFKHDPANPRSLPDDTVSALHEDKQRRLWVGTQRGLALFDRRTEAFASFPDIRSRVTAIVEDHGGGLWVGTQGGGLFERHPRMGAFVAHGTDAADPDSLGSPVVSALHVDRRGRLWIGTGDAGVARLEPATADGQARFKHYRHNPRDPRSLSSNEVWGLSADERGRLWVATYGGGLDALEESGAFRHYRDKPGEAGRLGTDLLTSVLVDRAGTVWVGTDGAGVRRYDASNDNFVPLDHDPLDLASLSQSTVRALYEDGQGQLWVGTYLGGVNLLRRPRPAFDYFTRRPSSPEGLSHASVNAFLQDRAGRIWVGMEQGWLDEYFRGTGTFVHHRLPQSAVGHSAILALHQDNGGRIWIGTYRGGLVRFDPERGAFTAFLHRHGDPRSVAGDEIWAIAEAGDGSLWLGTNAGLTRFDPVRGEATAHELSPPGAEGLSYSGIRSLLKDRQGTLWVGSFEGLRMLKRGSREFVSYRHREGDLKSLSHDTVIDIYEDRQGVLWVGTLGGGLNRLDAATGTFTRYSGFPSNVIYGIQEDGRGRLWLSTNQGLARFDPVSGRVDNLDLTNGLLSLQFFLGASLQTRDRRLLFGSIDGFYDFDPDRIEADTFAPPVVFTSLRVFNEPRALPAALTTVEEITLSHADKVFSLEFAALDYAFPRRNQYSYTMEGFSDRWTALGTKRDVTFTNLDPGTYVLRVKASNSDGVWSDASQAALRVVIRPPFWLTWWFRVLAVATFALVLASAHVVRVRRVTRDLAERARAERRLREAEEKYRGIFDNAVEGIFQSTADGRFRAVNPAMVRMLGYASPQEMLEQVTDIERQLYADPSRRREMLRLVQEQGVLRGFETELLRKDGSTLWVSVNVRVVPDAKGGPALLEGTIEDVSDRRRAEELANTLRRHETLSAMGSLVAGVAHEVRNPLFGVSANLDVLESAAGDRTELASSIGHIRAEVDRLNVLMKDLLDYGKPVVAEPQPAPIDPVLEEAMDCCAALATARDVTVQAGGASGLPPVLMDQARLVQVFENLVRNAIEHAPPGSVVSVETALESGENGRLARITVKDAGSGFVPEDLPRIFEPFFSRRAGGAGLGLAIAQRIVEEHGGTLSAANRPEGGAAVTVRLPVR